MSIDIGFETKNSLFPRITKEKFDTAITDFCTNRYFSGIAKYPQGYLLRFCPDGDLYIMYEKGKLFGSANTGVVGPGFHKACVDFLDNLGTMLNLSFIIHDCTDYATHRNFAKLKQEMGLWLKQLLTHSVSIPDMKELFLCWELTEYMPKGYGDLVTPRGLFPKSWVSPPLDAKQLESVGDLFWVWSNEGKDAQYYRGCALSIMWKDIIWRKPVTEEDARHIKKALSFLKKASELDPSIPLPITEWNELCRFIGDAPVQAANPVLEYPTAIGYRRNVVSYPFPSDFYMQLPGTFRMEHDSDGTQVLVDQDKSVRLSAIMYQLRNKNQDPRKDMTYLNHALIDERRIEFHKEGFRYIAQYGRNEDNQNESCILHGQIIGKDRCGIVTMCWNGLSESDWAVDCFKSIRVKHTVSEPHVVTYK